MAITQLLLLTRGYAQALTPLRFPHAGLLEDLQPALQLLVQGVENSDAVVSRKAVQELATYSLRLASDGLGVPLRAVLSSHENATGIYVPHNFDQDTDGAKGAFPGFENLTRRERQMAQEISRGRSNADIAKSYGISTRTVEGHLYQIYAKVSVPHRRALQHLMENGYNLEVDETA